MSSQRHKRTVHGYDSSGETPYTLGDLGLPAGAFTDDLGGQTYNFLTYFPTATNFVLSGTPTGMSLNASTGLLDGTPTTVQAATVTLTVTYATPVGARTKVVNWSYAVTAA